MSVDLFAPGSAAATLLLGARVGGLVLVAPVFSARTVPMTVRTALLVVLTFLLQPMALARAGVPRLTPESLLTETLIGFAMGLGAAIFVAGAEAAGDLISIQIGLSGAALLDPLTQQSVPVLGQFMQLFAVTLLLSLDAHLIMLDALAASTRFLPLGGPVDVRAGLGAMLAAAGMLFGLGIRFAGPVIAAALISNVALAILGRAAPQLNILAVAFPVQIGVGLFVLAASLPLIAVFFGDWAVAYDAVLTRILGAFAGGGR